MLSFILLAWTAAFAAQHEHAVMGFDLDKTVHHFGLTPTGGCIEVAAKDASDATSVAQIRLHLREIAGAFARGRFEAPFATHGEVPPGVPVMQARMSAIAYRYEEIAAGGRVVITTAEAAARAALHDFLRYQIRQHATGDPVDPPSPRAALVCAGGARPGV
jgi:hypothetical protein